MAIQAELRKDNPSPRGGTIYKMHNDAVTPYQRYQNATTAAEKREALKQMAALYMKEAGRDDDEDNLPTVADGRDVALAGEATDGGYRSRAPKLYD